MMNVGIIIDRITVPHRPRRPLPLEILYFIQKGAPLRAIHDYLPGATWAKIADTIHDAHWRKLLREAVTP